MGIVLAALKETLPHEQRVAIVPTVAERLSALGVEVRLQAGAGDAVNLPDAAFKHATIIDDPLTLVSEADVVISVQPPPLDVVNAMKEAAILISFIYSQREVELVKRLAYRKITCFAMELIPRITRAQTMDALTSQAALAGYYTVLLGATHLGRILPMMTTAVGMLRPATVLVMGLGVAGLEALATAHRLGAIVEGYDVRPETKEQAASVGARFIDTGVNAVGEGGYARELTAEEQAKVAAAITAHLQRADLIITTAAVPGRPAPKLISKSQVNGMKPGAVIVDLAADGGGNCEYTRPGETAQVGHVTILGPLNVPSCVGEHASELYAKNVYNVLALMIHDKALVLDWQDEILASAVLTHAGEVKNEFARRALGLVAAAS